MVMFAKRVEIENTVIFWPLQGWAKIIQGGTLKVLNNIFGSSTTFFLA